MRAQERRLTRRTVLLTSSSIWLSRVLRTVPNTRWSWRLRILVPTSMPIPLGSRLSTMPRASARMFLSLSILSATFSKTQSSMVALLNGKEMSSCGSSKRLTSSWKRLFSITSTPLPSRVSSLSHFTSPSTRLTIMLFSRPTTWPDHPWTQGQHSFHQPK